MHTLTLITIEFAAAAHLMMSLVLFFFARRRVSYLSQAWIMLLFCLMYCAALFFIYTQDIPPLGILHPVLLLYLLATSFLQSIYPLGICMPGYLQWGRMWTYAVPALVLILLYAGGALAGSNMVKVYDAADFGHYLLSGDVILRLASLALSIYYIVNIFRLPHRLTRQVELPRWMITYGVALGLVALYFVLLTVWFSQPLVIIYIVLFTLVNMFLSCAKWPSARPRKKSRTRSRTTSTKPTCGVSRCLNFSCSTSALGSTANSRATASAVTRASTATSSCRHSEAKDTTTRTNTSTDTESKSSNGSFLPVKSTVCNSATRRASAPLKRPQRTSNAWKTSR